MGVARDGLRLVPGGAAIPARGSTVDPVEFQDVCLQAYEASQIPQRDVNEAIDHLPRHSLCARACARLHARDAPGQTARAAGPSRHTTTVNG